MYLASLGFCIFFGICFDNILSRVSRGHYWMKVSVIAFLVGICILLSAKTISQCRIWKDSFTLWKYILEKYQNSSVANDNMGVTYISLGDHEKAIEFLKKAISLEKFGFEAYANLGTVYYSIGSLEEAEKYMKKALMIEPDSTPALNTLGLIWERKGNFKKAEEVYLNAIGKGDADSLQVRMNLAKLYRKQGNFISAEELYQENLFLDPNHKESLLNLFELYIIIEEDQAEKIFQLGKKVLKTNRDVRVILRLGGLLASNNYSKMALSFFAEAIHLDPKSKDVYLELGKFYGNFNKFDEAIIIWKEGLSIDPEEESFKELIKRAKELKLEFDK